MKKIFIAAALGMVAVVFSYCSGSKKAASSKVSFEKDLLAIVNTKCGPCHIPSKGGKKDALDTQEALSKEIDDVIRRIKLEPNQRGFMPVRGEKLPAAEIALFEKWKETGMSK